jgi:hypothetical protein
MRCVDVPRTPPLKGVGNLTFNLCSARFDVRFVAAALPVGFRWVTSGFLCMRHGSCPSPSHRSKHLVAVDVSCSGIYIQSNQLSGTIPTILGLMTAPIGLG